MRKMMIWTCLQENLKWSTLWYKNRRRIQTIWSMQKKKMKMRMRTTTERITYWVSRKKGDSIWRKKMRKRKTMITAEIMGESERPRRDREPLAATIFLRKSIKWHTTSNKWLGLVEDLFPRTNSTIIIELLAFRCLTVKSFHKQAVLHTVIKYGEILGRHYKTSARTIARNKMEEQW